MSKSERLHALIDKINEVIPSYLQPDVKTMLWQFVKGYKIKAYREEATGIKRAWYTIIAVPLFIDGFIRDVRVNSTAGKYLFGSYSIGDRKYAGLSTLTGTIQRIVDAGPEAPNYELAVQIGTVLNDYDEGHINFGEIL